MEKEVIDKLIKFRDDRDWQQFHSGENLAKALIIEAAELLELFQWKHEIVDINRMKEELADVFLYATLLANTYNLDIKDIMLEKIAVNEKKYPIDKAKGSNKKYNEL